MERSCRCPPCRRRLTWARHEKKRIATVNVTEVGTLMAIARSKLDIVFSLLVRERAGNVCEASGATARECQLECCHVEGRRNRSTRWHPDNAFCLSHAMHLYYTENPISWAEWVRRKLGEERYHANLRLAHSPRKFTPREIEGLYRHYQSELKRLRVARSNGRTGRIEFIYPDPIPESQPRARAKKRKPSKWRRKVNGQTVPRAA